MTRTKTEVYLYEALVQTLFHKQTQRRRKYLFSPQEFNPSQTTINGPSHLIFSSQNLHLIDFLLTRMAQPWISAITV